MLKMSSLRDFDAPTFDNQITACFMQKKVVNSWREKGLLEAIKTAATEDPREITFPIHWITTKSF